MEKKDVLGKHPPARKTKTHKGTKIMGGVKKGRLPVPQAHASEGRGFDRMIESAAEEYKLKYPKRVATIDGVVAEFKERYKAGLIHDWLDTMQEFHADVMQPAYRSYNSRKRTANKR